MSNGVDEKVINKIKKLMALGLGDPDSPEAKAAMDKAAVLMAKYGVAEVDLDADGHVKADSLMEEFVEIYGIRTEIWEGSLAAYIADAFDCKVITIRHNYLNGNSARAFLGTKSDVALATYFYKFIRMQILRRAEDAFRLVKDQKAYGCGCVVRVSERLEEMYKKRQEVMTSDSRDLIIVKKDDVDKFYNEQYPGARKGRKRKITGSADAYSQGKEDGDKIAMSRQVGNKSATGATLIGG